MAIAPIWLSKAGDLGIIPAETYYELQFDAYNPLGGTLTYFVVTGSLPAGLTLSSSGFLSGAPNPISKVTTSSFTVRVKNDENKIADRTFSLSVGGLLPPNIIPDEISLGVYSDGTRVDIQLAIENPNPLLTPVFSVLSGELPSGVTLSPNGLLYGFIRPIPAIGIYGPLDGPIYTALKAIYPDYGPDFDWVNPDDPSYFVGFDQAGFDSESTAYVSKNFQFTVQVDNGVYTDTQTYNIFVFAGELLTADSTDIFADSTVFTADTVGIASSEERVYSPVVYTLPGSLGAVAQEINVAFQIVAEDFNNDTLTYEAFANPGQTGLPPGVAINPASGWIYGTTTDTAGVYTFTARVRKTNNAIEYYSNEIICSITVLGEDTFVWRTLPNLGTIRTGEISKLYIDAYTINGQELIYELATAGAMPNGLLLLPDGTISGRSSFQMFDSAAEQTFENQTYTFTVSARTADLSIYEERTFTLTLIAEDHAPYENLYTQLLPSRAQRDLFYSILNDSLVFPEENLYRPLDPWFGKNRQRRMLLQTGLTAEQANVYISAMELNHYNKELYFGDVKTARALDENFNPIYEVVYLDVVDSLVDNSNSISLSIEWPTNTSGITNVYPNSFPNMAQRITDGVGYQNRGIIPQWMESRQEDGTVPGFKRVFVLCYAQPGKSAEIAYNVKRIIESFGELRFTIDRYIWDQTLSTFYDKSIDEFYSNNYVIGNGTIEAAENSPYVTGFGTAFTSEVFVNDQIVLTQHPNPLKNNQLLGIVKAIHSDGNIELYANSSITSWDSVQEPYPFKHIKTDGYSAPGDGDKYLKFPQGGILS